MIRKWITLLLVIAVGISALTACQPMPDSSYEPLSAEKIAEIKAAWEISPINASKGRPCLWDLTSQKRYYGTHGDCVAIFSEGLTTAIEILDVAGVKIWNGNRFHIYIYRDGEFAELADAYEKGWIEKKHVESIAEHHKEQLPYYPDESQP